MVRWSGWFARLSDVSLGVMGIWELLWVCLRFFAYYKVAFICHADVESFKTSKYTTFVGVFAVSEVWARSGGVGGLPDSQT